MTSPKALSIANAPKVHQDDFHAKPIWLECLINFNHLVFLTITEWNNVLDDAHTVEISQSFFEVRNWPFDACFFCVNCRHTCMNDKNILNEWFPLTHYGRVTHICVCKPTITGSDNDLSPGRRQAIIWTNAGILTPGVVNWEVIHQTANPSRTQQGYHWSPSWVLVTPHLKWQHICGT